MPRKAEKKADSNIVREASRPYGTGKHDDSPASLSEGTRGPLLPEMTLHPLNGQSVHLLLTRHYEPIELPPLSREEIEERLRAVYPNYKSK